MKLLQLQRWINNSMMRMNKNIRRYEKKDEKSYDTGYSKGYKACLDMMQCYIGDCEHGK